MADEGEAASCFLDASLTVLEVGERRAAGAAGSLLAQLGCRVIQIQPVVRGHLDDRRAHLKWAVREQFAVGKQCVVLDPNRAQDRELCLAIAARADLVISSSDVDRFDVPVDSSRQIHCDVTAFGRTGPLAGRAFTDGQIQALTGVLDTTGSPDGPPVLVGGDAVEFTTGIYAATACVAAFRSRRQGGFGQVIDMALFDCGFSSVATFLPKYFQDEAAVIGRAGNRHPLTGPWNVFGASDGWVLICTANDSQWQRLCAIMGRSDLASAEQYATTARRMERMPEIDIAISAWAARRSVAECVAAFEGTNVASGPIAPMDSCPREANLEYRRMIRRLGNGSTGEVCVPASPIRAVHSDVRQPEVVPGPDDGRDSVMTWLSSASERRGGSSTVDRSGARALPLEGVRVIEIGHYTTAPLSARHLASLGADVIKLEPPGGEGMRGWPPNQVGQGLFFTYTNADKRSLTLDLNSQTGVAIFEALVAESDVLVENLKPGALDKRGLGWSRLSALNPRLIYCAISGFGEDTLYAGRAAFETVIQAMCGLMAINLAEGVPVKAGIPSADLMGAQLCVLNVLAALEARERTGRGDYFDLAMQDVAAWATQTAWNQAAPAPNASVAARARMEPCADGVVYIEQEPASAVDSSGLSRQDLVDRINTEGGIAAPVLRVNEAASHPQTAARGLIFYATDYRGIEWPMMSSPMRLSETVPRTIDPMGELGRHSVDIVRAAGFDPDDEAVAEAIRST